MKILQLSALIFFTGLILFIEAKLLPQADLETVSQSVYSKDIK